MSAQNHRMRQLAQAILLAALLPCAFLVASWSVQAAFSAPVAASPTLPPLTPTRLDPATIVVGAPAADISAPAKGVTGTTALPALPVGAAAAAAIVAGEPAGVVPARPFAWGAATALDRARAAECLTAAIYYEAATEPDVGQRAVAQVVLNRVRHPAFPASVCGVVYQGSERAGCQFSFACDGAMARAPAPAPAAWSRAARTAAAALAGYVYAPVGLATHYHTFAVTPAWNRTLVMTDAEGAHFFHRWKGYWGTAAAFSQRYAAAEPQPGPHPRTDTAAPIALPATAPTLAPPPAAALRDLQTAVRDAAPPAMPTPPAATAAKGGDDSQILPRWRDSGRPIDQ